MKYFIIISTVFTLIIFSITDLATANDVCNCRGYKGLGSPCYDGPGEGEKCPNVCY